MADDGDKPLGTVQLPRGAILDAAAIASPASEMPTVADRQPAAEPIGKTVVPASDIAADLGTPPELPPPWRYELTVEIARGGMGRVVEANDLVLGRTVALKEALSRDPDSIKRFERETRITARLEHPSIVPVHDAGTTPVGAPFYVMRKIGGRPLEELVGKLPELTDRLALLPHMVASANAVAHAHERGIVHRDVKPSNILVGDLGETMLIDWGLAKALGEPDPDEAPRILAPVYEDDSDIVKTRAGVVFGTPGFMAPEQLRGAPPDERCDVYALGATMYHLLARRPPHYSKNAADMMRAAVDGPAEPLRHRVPGVPPELATIVDKALAFERDDRYRSARALADDLQRFIGGQLVASHHYSQREKLARWVRNNRTTVTVAATALVAMVAGGSFAVSRIVAARDREHLAAEKAREQTKLAEAESTKATASLEALQLADARNLTLDDPTRAIAMVKPLVPTRWREARDVAAAARANGVAYSLPASPHAVSLELSRDGQRALEAGDDGIVRIYDLAKRTQTVIADAKTPTPAHFGDAEHTVVLFRDNHITLVDVATKSRRDVMTPTAIARLEVAGPIAYWIDPQHALWKLDLAGGQASKVATDEPIDGVFPSPDGRWIALGGSQHVFLIDRTAATTPPQPITGASNIHALQWSADALHAVMLTDDELVDLKVDEVPHVDHRYNVGRLRSVAWSRRGTYATGALGVELLHRDNDDHGVRVQAADCTLGLYATWNDAIVAGRPTKLSIVSDDGDRVIDSPLRLEKLAASPHGPFIAAATEGALLVWDLEAVLPRHVGDAAPTGAGFVTSDAVIASYDGAPAQWIDLRNNMPTPLGELQPIVSVTGSPDGQRAFVIDVTHRGRIVAPVGDPVELDADIDRAEFVDEHHLVLATSQGAVLVAEPSQPRGARSLVKRDAQVVALAASAADGGWIAAAFADHALWRAQLDGKAEALQQLRLPPGKAGLALGRDGEVVVASGPELRVWRADGTLDTLWTAPHSIHELAYIDALHVLAIASDGKATIVDTREPNHVQAINVEIASPTLAGDASLAAMVTSSGTLELADPLASEHWQLAPRGRGMTGVQLSPDGKRVIAIAGDHLLAWTPALPDGVDATTRWLDALTNAAIDRGPTAALGWKMLKPPTP